jgi:hypothetical protein
VSRGRFWQPCPICKRKVALLVAERRVGSWTVYRVAQPAPGALVITEVDGPTVAACSKRHRSSYMFLGGELLAGESRRPDVWLSTEGP